MSYNPNLPAGQAAMASSSPVVIANNQTAVPVSFTGSTDAATQTTLAAIKAKTDNIPALGQALAASSVPVILPSATISTLTPPAAITNFANETGGNLAAIKTDVDKIPSQGQALAAASMPVVLTAAQISTLTPLSSVTVSGAVTNTVLSVVGGGTEATAQRVTIASDSTGLLSVDDNGGALTVDNGGTFAVQATPVTQVDTFMLGGVNVKEINAVTPLMGNGVTGTGSQRVTIASDNTAFSVNAAATLAAETTKVIGVTRTADGSGNLLTSTTNALDVNIKTGTVTTHPVTIVSGGVASGAIASGAIASGAVASGAIAAGALASGAAVSGAFADGAQVTLGAKADAKSTATDTTAVTAMQVLKEISYMEQNPASQAVTNAGTFAVQQTGATGSSIFHLVSAGSTNLTNVKASAGVLTGWYIYNSNAAARKVAFHNTAGTPTAGSGVVMSLVIPPTAGANAPAGYKGAAFSTGIAISTVTGLADSDTAAVAANDLIINLFYD